MALLYDLIGKYRQNRRVLLFIVYIALFLDNMLLTTVGTLINVFSVFFFFSKIRSESKISFDWVQK